MAKQSKTGSDESSEPKDVVLHSFKMAELDPVGYLSTGLFPIDLMLLNASCDKSNPMGVGYGRMIEIFGPHKSGKSELAQALIRQAVKDPLFSVDYYDQEWSADSRKLGISPSEWDDGGHNLYRADTLEEFYGACKSALRALLKEQISKKTVGTAKAKRKLILIDSVTAVKTKAVNAGEVGDVHIAPDARVHSQELPQLRRLIGMTQSVLGWVNQTRHAPGNKMPGASSETTPGGEAPRFYADYRIRCGHTGYIWKKSGKLSVKGVAPNGFCTACKCVKNKLAPPMGEAEIALWYVSPGDGIPSGMSEAWSIFFSLHARKIIKPVSGTGTYTVASLDIPAFARSAWDGVYAANVGAIRALYAADITDD